MKEMEKPNKDIITDDLLTGIGLRFLPAGLTTLQLVLLLAGFSSGAGSLSSIGLSLCQTTTPNTILSISLCQKETHNTTFSSSYEESGWITVESGSVTVESEEI